MNGFEIVTIAFQLRIILQVHIKSGFILNGVCVLWRGWIDWQRLEGFGCLEFDEYRAYLEEAMAKQQSGGDHCGTAAGAMQANSNQHNGRNGNHAGRLGSAGSPTGAGGPPHDPSVLANGVSAPAGPNLQLGAPPVGAGPLGLSPASCMAAAASLVGAGGPPPVSLAEASHYGNAAIAAAAAAAFHQALVVGQPGAPPHALPPPLSLPPPPQPHTLHPHAQLAAGAGAPLGPVAQLHQQQLSQQAAYKQNGFNPQTLLGPGQPGDALGLHLGGGRGRSGSPGLASLTASKPSQQLNKHSESASALGNSPPRPPLKSAATPPAKLSSASSCSSGQATKRPASLAGPDEPPGQQLDELDVVSDSSVIGPGEQHSFAAGQAPPKRLFKSDPTQLLHNSSNSSNSAANNNNQHHHNHLHQHHTHHHHHQRARRAV